MNIILDKFKGYIIMNNTILDKMTLREKLGQLIMMDFRFYGKDHKGDYLPVQKFPPAILKLISDYQLGGTALFRENTGTPEQIIKLIAGIQNSSKIPQLIGIDQEGGIVTRLQTGTNMPGNMALGAANDYELTKEVAAAIGKELNALGINLNFAPTVDVNSCAANPIIGVRSFGSNPELVSEMGKAYVEGLHSSSVLACLKHFPGHGNTVNDTHLGLANVDYSYEEWERIDLEPFRQLINNGADTIMAAHVIIPELDNSKCISKLNNNAIGTPATLSYKILTEILRNKLNFEGLILTDALDMKAISDNFGAEKATVKTILAGADIAVMPVRIWEEKDIYKLEKLILHLEYCYKNNSIFKERVEESVKRIINFKIEKKLINNFSNINLSDKIDLANKIVGCKDHKLLEQKASASGVTLIKNEGETIPFNLNYNSKILALDCDKNRLQVLIEDIITKAAMTSKNITIESKIIDYTSALDDNLKRKIKESDFIIMVTYNLDSTKTLPEEIAKYSQHNNKKLVSISGRNPYDIAYMKSCKANIAIYGVTGFDQTNYSQTQLSVNLKTAVKILFSINHKKSILNPTGKLPVSIEDPVTRKNIYNIGHGLSY